MLRAVGYGQADVSQGVYALRRQPSVECDVCLRYQANP
jgi:hypothetical protein